MIGTYPNNNEEIRVPESIWILQNLTRSKRRSGGFGFIFKLKLFSRYYVLLKLMSLCHKLSGYCIASVYILPQNSQYGKQCLTLMLVRFKNNRI